MKLRSLLTVILMLAGLMHPAKAAMSDFAPAFQIDLETQQLPTLAELQKSFKFENTLYDTRYTSVFDLGNVFNRDFYAVIATYGTTEKRMKWQYEDLLLEMLEMMPKEMYQYVGPMLFRVPGISEKILNLPGIKETKNQFPSRVAPQLKHLDDLEFLSPELYFLLMPEIWPGNESATEFPVMRPGHPKVVYDDKFYQSLRRLVPPEQYMTRVPAAKDNVRSRLRTTAPDQNSLLTAADAQAVVRTLPAVEKWADRNHNRYKLSTLTTMWLNFEQQQDKTMPLPVLKDMVNPCQRLVQKATIMGEERELAEAAAEEGFTLNEWAYSCDKVMKAYRLSMISPTLIQAIKSYVNGTYDEEIKKMSPEGQAARYAAMQAIIEMYNAPLSDVMEVRKVRPQLHQQLLQSNFKIAGTPVTRLD